jgi:exopolysaccharide production protein ExoZ
MTLLPQSGVPAYDFSWTLERELVFYAIATLTVPLIGVRGLAVVLAALAAAGWYFGNPWTYHLVSTTQADFLAGVVVFLIHRRAAYLWSALPITAGVALLAYTRSHDFVFSVTLCMGCILLGMVNLRLPWQRWPFRWLVAIGNASYSVYLLHYLTFFALVNIAARVSLPDWMCEPWRLLSITVCCLISHLTWRTIEEPMIRQGNRLTATWVKNRSHLWGVVRIEDPGLRSQADEV